jgi:hypothetical protein
MRRSLHQQLLGTQASYGIGGDGEVRLYLGAVEISGKRHTLIIALDADYHADLLSLEKAASSVISSVRLAGTEGSA